LAQDPAASSGGADCTNACRTIEEFTARHQVCFLQILRRLTGMFTLFCHGFLCLPYCLTACLCRLSLLIKLLFGEGRLDGALERKGFSTRDDIFHESLLKTDALGNRLGG